MNKNLHSQEDDLETAKLCSLEHLNAQIGELEKSIEEMRVRRKQLEEDLAVIRASKAPIRRLPTEIFVLIFEETLYGHKVSDEESEEELEEDASNIADLMLVCMSWYRIIIGAPILWSKITVRAAEEKFGGQWVSRQAKYVEAFMEYSGRMPVDVSLDFTSLLTAEEYACWKVENFLKHFIHEVASEGEEKIHYQYNNMLDEMWGETLIGLSEGLYWRLVNSIVGEDGIYMNRWRSLRLVLPRGDNEFAAKLLNYLDHPAPQLRELDIHARDLERSWEPDSLLRLSTLDRIVLRGTFMPSLIPESFGAQRVELIGARYLNGVDRINSFRNLQHLRLQAAGRTTNPAFHPITLHHLQTLRLGGYIPDSLFQAFTIRLLPELTIDCLGEGKLGYVPYPTADLFRMVGIVNIIVPEYRYNDPGIRQIVSHLAGLFTQLSVATSIGIVDKVATEVISLIEGCRVKEELTALQSLVTVYESGDALVREEYATFSPLCTE